MLLTEKDTQPQESDSYFVNKNIHAVILVDYFNETELLWCPFYQICISKECYILPHVSLKWILFYYSCFDL